MKTDNYYIYGKNPVIEALRETPKSVMAVFVKDSVKDSTFEEIRALAKKHKIIINSVEEDKIVSLVGEGNSHQGITAKMKPFHYENFGEWLVSVREQEKVTLLILDRIQDVNNFGAITRSAKAFGVDAILVGEHNQSPVNGAVWRSSAGMISKIKIIEAGNLNVAIDALKNEKFWIIGLDKAGKTSIDKYEQDSRMAIVLGSEGDGIREKTVERCDTVVSIPINKDTESLNVSVSAGIVLYERYKFLKG